jgi:hypothetical protein
MAISPLAYACLLVVHLEDNEKVIECLKEYKDDRGTKHHMQRTYPPLTFAYSIHLKGKIPEEDQVDAIQPYFNFGESSSRQTLEDISDTICL